MAGRSLVMRVHNRTSHTLTKTAAVLVHGRWSTDLPPDVVTPGQTVSIGSDTAGALPLIGSAAPGTEGTIRYASDGGGELFFQWRNPLVGQNTFQQGAPVECGLCFSGGVGDNAELDLQLVPSARVSVPDFLPSIGGFPFANSWPDEPLRRLVRMPPPFGDISIGNASNGICGGMAYAAADYFLAGQRPRAGDTSPPSTGDPLFDYLVTRLFDSFDLPGGVLSYYKYMEPLYPDTPRLDALGRAWVMAHEGFPAVMAAVDAERPCPIGLVMIKSLLPADLGHNHQVLAYAYQLDNGRATIWVYDPNSPGRDDITLSFDLSNAHNTIDVTHNVNAAGPITTFFATTYRPKPPPQGVPMVSAAVG